MPITIPVDQVRPIHVTDTEPAIGRADFKIKP